MSKNEVMKVSDFKKNRDNPFIAEAIERIDNNVVKKIIKKVPQFVVMTPKN